MKKFNKLLATLSAAILFNSFAHAAELKSYSPLKGVSGNINSVGSDTLANLMALWVEDFKTYYPNVVAEVQAAGSSTAPPALIEATSNFGPMSRKMKDKEIAAFKEKFGYEPTRISVALDVLTVFVNKDNPIKQMTMEEVDAVFSSVRKCGGKEDITNWSQLGISGKLASQEIQLFGRNSVSGTYSYFKKNALCKGDFKASVNEQPGSSSVVQAIGKTLSAIGYSGIGYVTPEVKTVALSKKGGKSFYEPVVKNILNGKYPLSRHLYIYINKDPNKDLSPLQREFIKYILSAEGQEVVRKDGYIALPAKIAKRELGKL